ncbi:MAG: 4-hydroxybenzoate 3-monooxygenase [Paracoccaceae bacterium]
MRTDVAIIGGGPAGMLLAHLLAGDGIDSVVLERRSRAHVLARVRAGVLEDATVRALRDAGLGARLAREGTPHRGFEIAFRGERLRIDVTELTGREVTLYGQTDVTRDLYTAADAREARLIHGAENVAIEGADTASPRVHWQDRETRRTLDCAFVAGCDGFHGASRRTIPGNALRCHELVYPFGWLGILSETRPAAEELIYARHDAGFALCSMRGPRTSRYYIQVPAGERPEDWPEARFWDALAARLPAETAATLETGPAIERAVAPLRSFVAEPMGWGRLFLAGDAAHIVPPTGAKGLNLAVGDVALLHRALAMFFRQGDETGLEAYSERALDRVWKTERFSWWMTRLLHAFPEDGTFADRIQAAEFAYLSGSRAAQTALAENYAGLPHPSL